MAAAIPCHTQLTLFPCLHSGGGAGLIRELCVHLQHAVGPAQPAERRACGAGRGHEAGGVAVPGHPGGSPPQAPGLHPQRAGAAQQWKQRDNQHQPQQGQSLLSTGKWELLNPQLFSLQRIVSLKIGFFLVKIFGVEGRADQVQSQLKSVSLSIEGLYG